MMKYNNDSGLMVVGDAMLDIVAFARTHAVDTDYVEASIRFEPGGSGVNLALAASAAGYKPVTLVCSFGADNFANSQIKDFLKESSVDLIINQATDQPAGVSIIAYLDSKSRMMFADPGVNSVTISRETINRACDSMPDLLLVSGYMLFRESTRDAVLEVMQYASSVGTAVVLDCVPHSIHREIPSSEFRRLLTFVDFIAAEQGTLASLNKFVDALSLVKGCLQYRVGAWYRVECWTEVVAVGDFPHPSARSELRGMTDRLLISVLRDYLPYIMGSA